MAGRDRSGDEPRWVFHSAAPSVGSSLVDDAGVELPASGEHPFRIRDEARYPLGAMLGWGGMGEVLAVHDRRLNREIAYKRVAPGRHGAAASARLAREAWITAHLEHPGIVPVYDAGVSEDGHLFYAMRLVRGRSLAEAIAAAEGPEARLGLLRHLLDACEAMAFAHSTGVVHRDVKPANIMVGSFGETQIVDWGLAIVPDEANRSQWRALGLPGGPGEDPETSGPVGTPAYMSPEQARGDAVDARSDVWSLGAVLYELLTGTPPHVGQDHDSVLARASRGVVDPVRRRAPEASPELAAIAERALHPRASERYATAGELAAELARWFEGRQVQAYSYTAFDLLKRFAIAWRAPLLVAGTAVLALAGLGGWTWQRTVGERNRAQAAERSALDALSQKDEALARALVEKAWVAASTGARPEAEVLAARSLQLRPSPDARGVLAAFAAQPRLRKLGELGLPRCARYHLDHHATRLGCVDAGKLSLWTLPAEHGPTSEDGGDALLRWEVELEGVDGVLLQPDTETLMVHAQDAVHFLDGQTGASVATRHDRATLGGGLFQATPAGGRALGGRSTRLHLVDLAAQSFETVENPCDGSHGLGAAARHPQGRGAVICRDGRIQTFDDDHTEAHEALTPFAAGQGGNALAWLPDGERVVIGTLRGGIGVVEADTGETDALAYGPGGTVRSVVPSPDGELVAVVTERAGVQLWSPRTGLFVGRLPARAREAARWGADGTLFTLADGRLEHWAVPEAPAPVTFDIGVGLSSASPSPDGRSLAVSRADNTVEVRDITTGGQIFRDTRQGNVCKRIAWTPDGAVLLATCIGEQQLRAWETVGWTPYPSPPLLADAKRLGVLNGGLVWALTYSPHGLATLRLHGDRLLPTLAEGFFVDGQTAASRDLAVALSRDGGVYLISGGERASARRVTTELAAIAAGIDGDGDVIAVLTDAAVRILDGDGDERTRIPHAARSTDVTVSPDGRLIATGARDGAVRVFDTSTGELVGMLIGHDERIATVEFSATGDSLYSASWDGTVRRWGLSALDAPVDELVDQTEAAWDLDMAAALSSQVR